MSPPVAESVLGDILTARSVRSFFQPIHDLRDGSVVGVEALARGPVGSPLETPDALFAAARAQGRVAELDRVCVHRALQAVRLAQLHPRVAVFLNVEAESLGAVAAVLREARASTAASIVIEVTERSLLVDPGALIHHVGRLRAEGFRIALDDVGANGDTVAMLPFVRPDVVKLDMSLVQDQPTALLGRIATAVAAYAERRGAHVLAEGIETERHLAIARTLGATLGQGWRFGRAEPTLAPLAVRTDGDPSIRFVDVSTEVTAATPFDVAVRAGLHVERGDFDVLVQISKQIESQVRRVDDVVMLAAFQHAARFTPGTARRYAALAEISPLVAALAVGLEPYPVAGVRGAHLDPHDPLVAEWAVVAVGPHFVSALLARELDSDASSGSTRSFAFALTHDRNLVEAAAATMLDRLAPA